MVNEVCVGVLVEGVPSLSFGVEFGVSVEVEAVMWHRSVSSSTVLQGSKITEQLGMLFRYSVVLQLNIAMVTGTIRN